MSQDPQNINTYLVPINGQNRTDYRFPKFEPEVREYYSELKRMENYLLLFKDLTFEWEKGLKTLKKYFQETYGSFSRKEVDHERLS